VSLKFWTEIPFDFFDSFVFRRLDKNLGVIIGFGIRFELFSDLRGGRFTIFEFQ
jgi:hypothetical protein